MEAIRSMWTCTHFRYFLQMAVREDETTASVGGGNVSDPSEVPGWSAIDVLIVGALICFGVILPVLASIGFHTVGIPQDDDWSYRLIATNFEQTGHLVFDGWNSMTLVGQVVAAWPLLHLFGDHGWVFTGFGALLGTIAIVAAYVIARHVLTRWWAWAAVALLLVVPGFTWSTSTFMTDVPALAAELTCLALGLAALGRQGSARWWFLGGALVVGVFGFSIREFAIAAPVAVILSAAAGDRRHWRVYVGLGAAVLVVSGIVYLCATSIAGSQPSTIGRPTHLSVEHVVQLYFEIALLLSPAVLLSSWRRFRWALSRQVVVGALTLLVGIGVLHYGLFLGDGLNQQGLFGAVVMVGGRQVVLPGPLWDLLLLVGLVSGALLAGLIASIDMAELRTWRCWPTGRPEGLLCVFAVLYAVGLVAYGLAQTTYFDRYAWPLVFVGGILLLRDCQQHPLGARHRSAVTLAAVLGLLLVAVSVVLTVDAYTYSAARWRAGQLAVAHGISAHSVDAGFEWVGNHARSNADSSLRPRAPTYERWYGLMEPGFRECAVVTESPFSAPGMHLLQTTEYQRYGFAGRTPLYIYVSSAPECRHADP